MVSLDNKKSDDTSLIIPAGKIIFNEGQKSKYLYLLKRGDVRLIKNHGGKYLTILKNMSSPGILNEISVLTQRPTEFLALAHSEVELILIDQSNITTVLAKSPDWIGAMMSTLCERLKATEDMIAEHNLNNSFMDQSLTLKKEEEARYFKAIEEFKPTH